MVKEHHAEDRHQRRDRPREREVCRHNRSPSEHGIANQLHRRGDGIDQQDRLHQAVAQLRERVDDRRCVHPQLHAKVDQDRQIAVLGRQARDDNAKAQAHHAQMHQCHGNEQPGPPVGRDRALCQIVSEEDQHEDHLHAELDDGGQHVGNRRGQAREIDLAEHARVGREGLRILRHAGGEEDPDGVGAQIEQQLRHAVRLNARDASENKRINDAADERIEENPHRPQHRLLVGEHKGAPGKQDDQIAVSPDLLQVQVEPAVLRCNMGMI